MIDVSWTKHKAPSKKRRKMADKQRDNTIARKRYLKSVRYCQKCGKGVYPNSDGEYALTQIKGEKMDLLMCDKCKNAKKQSFEAKKKK